MKIDLKKTYGSIEWVFVERMLQHLNFPPKLIGLIMQCITTPTYSIVLNGQPLGYFKGRRGLRQGDPISPLPFILCMEYLSRLLDEVCSYPGFHFHPLFKKLKLVHLVFADDLLIFCKGDLRSIVSIMEVFKCFSAASSLQISSEKSDIIFNGLDSSLATSILDYTDNICLKGASILDYTPTSYSSWSWRKICEVKDKMLSGYFNDKWLGGEAAYTIDSGYKWLSPSAPGRVPWYTEVWNKFNIPKHNFILWLIKQGSLLTLDRLVKMGIATNQLCYICGVADETHSHLFSECGYTKRCYRMLADWLSMQVTDVLEGSVVLRMRQLSGFRRLLICEMSDAIQYRVWNSRNICRVDGYVIHPRKMLQDIRADCKLRLQVLSLGCINPSDKLWCTTLGIM
ncbi:uncharacterized protein LOC141590361 [Silene latifolia]|uniref:uncharacterized protein LOC141590361 n=1 Tax=Silene latifolia TaxID=37657 RepID=UPI003D7843E0